MQAAMIKKIKDPRMAIIVVMILIVLFLTYRYFAKPSSMMPPQDIKVVEVEKLQLKDIAQTTRLIGALKAKNSSTIVAQGDGVLDIILNSGVQVNKGELIAKIENNEVEKNYQLLSGSEAIAKEQFERAKILLKSGTYSKNQFEDAKNTWINAQKNLADSKIALDKLKFYAPFSGMIGHYKIKSGQQVQIGDKIVSFYDPASVRVDFDIPLSAIANVNTGQVLWVLNQQYQLNSVQKMLDEEKHMSPASVDISCDDCIIGSNVDVDLVLLEKKQVIVIPFEAVFLKDGKSSVYTIEDNKAVLKNVELGLREKELVEVTSGLKVNDMIVIRGTGRLYPGVSVKIHQENKE